MKRLTESDSATPVRWSVPPLQTADAPSLDRLRQTTARRRQLRRSRATLLTAAAACVVSAILLGQRDRSAETVVRDAHNVRDSRPPAASIVASATEAKAPPSDHVKAIEGPRTSVSAPTETETATDFKLFARIRNERPVFAYDDHRQALVPIGWIRSTDVVPVDIDGLPQDQINSFRSILNDRPEKVVL